MKPFEPLDLMFFVLEKPTRPMHMTIVEVFEPPLGFHGSFADRVWAAYRDGVVGEPFNLRPNLVSLQGPHWERVDEVDLEYHVRRVTLPPPGTTAQLMDLAERLNEPLLDRRYPMWQCDIIDGLDGGRFALLVRIHHSYVDGMGGARMMAGALNKVAADPRIKFPWGARTTQEHHRPSRRLGLTTRMAGLVSGLGEQAMALSQLSARGLTMVTDALGVTHTGQVPPFSAPRTRLSVATQTAARSFAVCDVPLTETRRINAATETTVNDVALTIIDHALHRYLASHDDQPDRPLVASMPIATRTDGDDSASNRVGLRQLPLGDPDAEVADRLSQIAERSAVTKADTRAMSQAALNDYTLLMAGLLQAIDEVPGLRNLPPTHNLLISNVRGIPTQMYLGGARLRGTYPIPIVTPGSALNVTVFTNADSLCFGFGGSRDVLRDIDRLADFTVDAFVELTRAASELDAPRKVRVTTARPRRLRDGKERQA